MKKIGIYGGTFDPIHYAHLILAREALERLHIDKVIFVPAALSPHKLNEKPATADLRLEMVRTAVAGEPRFTVDERELQRPAPSFAIDTVDELRWVNADAELFYLIGSDNLPRLDSWHRIDELRKLVTFVVLSRTSSPPDEKYQTIHRQIDISATEIRNRVANGLSIRYLVPPEVEAIIHRHHLYQDSHRSPRKN